MLSGSSGGGVGVVVALEVELLQQSLGGSVSLASAVSSFRKDAGRVVGEVALKVSTALDKAVR